MPDEPRPSVVSRVLARSKRLSTVQAAGLIAGMTLAVFALYATAASGNASANGSDKPESRVAIRADSAADWQAFGAVTTFLETVARPSSTPASTPTATLTRVPAPTATAPAPAPTPAARHQPAAPPLATEPASTPVPAAPASPWGLDTSPIDGYSQALFDATNRRRIESGLPPLRVNGWLIGIARIRSQDMAEHNYFAHVSPITGDNAFTLMDKHGVPYSWAGENLAKNNYPELDTVSVADAALWNSPPHRGNILSPNYTDIGIALSIDVVGMKYFTIIFTGP